MAHTGACIHTHVSMPTGGAHARPRAAPPRSTPACACGNAAPRPSAHAIGASSGAGACVRSTLLLAELHTAKNHPCRNHSCTKCRSAGLWTDDAALTILHFVMLELLMPRR